MSSANVEATRSFVDFAGGYNADASSFTIRDDESPQLLNMRADPLGPITGRRGTARQNETEYSVGEPITSVFPLRKQDGSVLLLVVTADQLLAVDPATPDSPTTIDTLPVSGERWEFAAIKDWAYLVNLTGGLYRTDGTDLIKAGDKPPSAPTTADSGAGTTHTAGDTFYYRCTYLYRDRLGESPPSDPSAQHTVIAANTDIDVTCPASSPAHPAGDILFTRVYRTLNGAPLLSPYYFVGQIATDGGLFVDNVLDSGNAEKVETTRIVPVNARAITVHKNRLVLGRLNDADGDAFQDVTLSDAGAPEQWDSDRARYTSDNPNNESLTGIASYNGQLWCFTQNYANPLIGTGEVAGSGLLPDFRFVRTVKGPGAMSHRVIQESESALYTMNAAGVWAFTGNGILKLSRQRVQKAIRATLDLANAGEACAVTVEEHYRVTYPKKGGNGTPQYTLIFDAQAGGFFVDEGYGASDYAYLDGEGESRQLWLGEPGAASVLLQMDVANTDHVSVGNTEKAIVRTFRTKDFLLGRGGHETRVRLLQMNVLNVSANAPLSVTLYLDKDRAAIPLGSASITANEPLWGQFVWGQAKWGSKGTIRYKDSVTQSAMAERHGLKITQLGLDPPFVVERITFGISDKGVRHD